MTSMPWARSMLKKRSGLPMPATACTAVPAKACSGIVRPPTKATALLGLEPHAERTFEQRPTAVDDDGIRACAGARGGSRSGPAGNSQPLPNRRSPSMTTTSQSRAKA